MDKQKIQDKLLGLYFLTNVVEVDFGGKFILFVHAINQASGLNCTGLQEDDPEENYEIPSNWNSPQNGVYSLRYKNQEKKVVYFKLIKISDNININCAFEDNLFSLSTKISPLDLKTIDSEQNKDFLDKYFQEIIKKITPAQNLNKPSNQNFNDHFSQQQPQSIFNRSPSQNRNEPFFPQNNNPFGNYGQGDLHPTFPGLGGNFSGNLIGPNNPAFGLKPYGNPNFKYDPVYPDEIGQDIDNDLFMPQQPFNNQNKRGGFGGPGRGGFRGGRGGFGGFGNNEFM